MDEATGLTEEERRELSRRRKISEFRRTHKDSMEARERKSRAQIERVDREWERRLANAQTPEQRARLERLRRKQLNDRARRLAQRVAEDRAALLALLAQGEDIYAAASVAAGAIQQRNG